MKYFSILLIMAAYVTTSVAGLSLIKEATGLMTTKFLIGFVSYGAGFLIWILLLIRALPLSVAFPVSAGALIIGTQIAGAAYLRESLTKIHLLGVAAIMAGIVLIFAAGGQK